MAALVVAVAAASAPTALATAAQGAPTSQIVVLEPGAQAGDLGVGGVEVRAELEHLGIAVVDATPAEVAALERRPEVATVQPDAPVRPALTESVPYVGGTTLHGAGLTGAGTWVAVLDSGVATSHPTFAGAPIVEACFAPGGSSCPNGSPTQTGPGSAAPGTCGACGHGTHVAGIAVGRGVPAFGLGRGVAPGAGLVAVQVFTRPSGGAIPEGTESSVLAGLNHVAGLAASRRIAAVNLSVTVGTPSPTHCDAENPALKSAVDALRARRVVVVGASGNDYSTAGITAPSCLSNVVAVGSVDLPGSGLPERISAFTNSAPILDVLAPGSEITSAYPGGAATLSGTSMAAPHVAGAAAVFASRRPAASSATIARLLRESGVPVSDPLRGTFPRLDALGLLRSIGDGIGAVGPSSVALRNTLTSGSPTATVPPGAPGRVLVGDWDGNGTDTLGYRSGNTFLLTNRTDGQGPFVTFPYGTHTDTPLAGDWDGDGIDTVGIRRGNSYYLRNAHAGGGADLTYAYGNHTDTPVTGDWDGNGTDTPGVRRGNAYYLRNAHAGGAADHAFNYGNHTDTPVTGDWDGNGTDTPGIRRGPAFYLRLSNTSGDAQIVFDYGEAGALPIVGNWDGT